MASPSRGAFAWLLAKDLRELLDARAWWVLVAAMGPLVGFAFIGAVRTYAELSGFGGTSDGVGEAFSPLVGIWAPTFSACELAAAFLLPFVAIRLVAGDVQSGALALELQRPLPIWWRVASKTLVLALGWIVASVPTVIAVALWASYGGAVHVPELLVVAFGHLVNAALTVALASAAAAATDHPATAAIAALAVTVGTWILNLVAAVQGGVWEWAAGYTPTAMVAEFQHGLLRADAVAAAVVLVAAGLAVSGVWSRLGRPVARKLAESGVIAVAAVLLLALCGRLTSSVDLAENRMNSFRRGDEAALAAIAAPIAIEVHLAAEDPRRVDLDRRVIGKLRRVVPEVRVSYVAETTTGLMEQTREHYGEIRYDVGGRRVVSRSTTPEGALEAIYEAAGVEAPPESDADIFRGHPLAVPPTGAAVTFYGVWPVAIAIAALVRFRRTA